MKFFEEERKVREDFVHLFTELLATDRLYHSLNAVANDNLKSISSDTYLLTFGEPGRTEEQKFQSRGEK